MPLKVSIEAVRVAFVADRKVAEVAAELGVSKSTVQRHYRALRLEGAPFRAPVPGDRVQDVAEDLFGPLRRLADEINTRLAATPSDDPERDVKLVEQILRALERLESLTALAPPREPSPGDEPRAADRADRDRGLRAELERRFDSLRAAGAGEGVPERSVGRGA